jgi:hypothetical protein
VGEVVEGNVVSEANQGSEEVILEVDFVWLV